MNDDDVPNDDMPSFLRPALPGGLPFNDAALAALLADTEPPEPTPGLQHVAEVLAALTSSPASDELAGEASVLAEFRRGIGEAARSPGPRRPHRFTSRLGARAAVAAAVAALGLGGLATAAYAGMLPAPVQRLAHETIGAPGVPSDSPSKAHRGTWAGPGAGSPTAQRWCDVYAHGTPAQRAAVRLDLIRAAGGAGKIPVYCRTATHPGSSQGNQGTGASTGNQGKGASTGNHGKGNPQGNHGEGASHGNQGKNAPIRNQGSSAPTGNQGSSAPTGNQGSSASTGSQYRQPASHPEGKSSAQSGGQRANHGTPHVSGQSTHTTPHATGRSPRARR